MVAKPPNIINGSVYKGAAFMTQSLNSPIVMHRLRNAVGLTAGLYLGRKTMDILVGETPGGKKIEKEDLPSPLRPLHGVLAYNHFSDDPHDRWMRVFDLTVPAVIGAMGTAAGSASFFKKPFIGPVKTKMSLPAEKLFITDLEKRSIFEQSKPWSLSNALSAVFGSASGLGLMPSASNYSAQLGTLFAIRSERVPTLFGKLLNTHSTHTFRPTKLIDQMINYATHNPSAHPEQLNAYANGILKSWFKNVDEKQITHFVDLVKEQRSQFLAKGHLPAEAESNVREALKKMLSETGLEKTFIKIGLDPREAAVGDMGFFSVIAHTIGDAVGFGTTKRMNEVRKILAKGLETRHPELVGKAFNPELSKPSFTFAQKLVGGTILGGSAASFLAISTAKDAEMTDLSTANEKGKFAASYTQDNQPKPTTIAEASVTGSTQSGNTANGEQQSLGSHTRKHIIHSKKDHNFINGRMLDTAEGITDMFNVIDGLLGSHRVYCATGLTAGSWLGNELMKALTGFTVTGNVVKESEVFKPYQKLYKKLAYNPHADDMHNKWMQVVHLSIPAVTGFLGVLSATNLFFEQRAEKLDKAKYLDDVESKATMVQAKPWSYTAAITGLFSGTSGIPWLPLVNYNTNLGTRFSMGAGRKVSLPGLGKIWSGNHTLFPYGPPGMIDQMIKNAVNNKAYDPELLETYAIGVLKPWFDNVTPKQIEDFVMHVHAIRDKFFKEGGVPEELKAQLEKELKTAFKGAGLEQTLEDIGLHPDQAIIGNNGISGAIGERLGAGSAMAKLREDYKKSYVERISEQAKGYEHSLPRS